MFLDVAFFLGVRLDYQLERRLILPEMPIVQNVLHYWANNFRLSTVDSFSYCGLRSGTYMLESTYSVPGELRLFTSSNFAVLVGLRRVSFLIVKSCAFSFAASWL